MVLQAAGRPPLPWSGRPFSGSQSLNLRELFIVRRFFRWNQEMLKCLWYMYIVDDYSLLELNTVNRIGIIDFRVFTEELNKRCLSSAKQ